MMKDVVFVFCPLAAPAVRHREANFDAKKLKNREVRCHRDGHTNITSQAHDEDRPYHYYSHYCYYYYCRYFCGCWNYFFVLLQELLFRFGMGLRAGLPSVCCVAGVVERGFLDGVSRKSCVPSMVFKRTYIMLYNLIKLVLS